MCRAASGLGLLLVLGALGCEASPGSPGEGAQKPAGRLRVVATTTMIGDLAQEIGGDAVEVQTIMRPGGDPHLYQPTPADAKVIARADLILTNGLRLEGWIDDLVRNAGGKGEVVVLSEGIEALQDPQKTNYPDPHLWHDAARWAQVAARLRDVLVAKDPAHAEGYKARAGRYAEALGALHERVKAQIQTIPASRRVLITSHDAFQYYGRAYGLEVVAVQGLSTEGEAGAQDLARVIEVVRQREVPALFVETSVNPKLIEQISRETGAAIGGELYSDSLGSPGAPGATYLGMIEANTARIVEALRGKP
jgi:zinc/manganese transport system substrate-binding protein